MFGADRALLALMVVGLIGGCSGSPRQRDPKAPATATANATATIAAPLQPTAIAPFAPGTNCGLRLDATEIYWLETDIVPLGEPAPATDGAAGAALHCDEARGSLRRVSRDDFAYSTPVMLDYWPYGLVRAGSDLYWTGAACHGRMASTDDPSGVWRWDPSGPSSSPTPVGPQDRQYEGIIAAGPDIYVTDRSDRGSAVGFRKGRGAPETLVDRGVFWLVAVGDRLYWTDKEWTLWSRDLATLQTKKFASLAEMPMEGHVLGDLLLIRTSTQILVLSTRDGSVRHQVEIPDYGDRDDGAIFGGSYYLANGRDGLLRLEIATGIATRLAVGGEACGVVVDGHYMYWADRYHEKVFAWRSSAFDQAEPAPATGLVVRGSSQLP